MLVGECSITLQDVTMLLGLRIDGDDVTGITDGWHNLVNRVFGVQPLTSLKGGRL